MLFNNNSLPQGPQATRVYVAPQLKANSELYTKLQELKANLQENPRIAGRRSIHSISAAPDPL